MSRLSEADGIIKLLNANCIENGDKFSYRRWAPSCAAITIRLVTAGHKRIDTARSPNVHFESGNQDATFRPFDKDGTGAQKWTGEQQNQQATGESRDEIVPGLSCAGGKSSVKDEPA